MSVIYQLGRRRSTSFRPVASPAAICAQIVGDYIRGVRRMDSRPLEKIAPLAGLSVTEWQAIEAGEMPATWEAILLMAAVLRIGPKTLSWLVKFYAGAFAGQK